MSETELINHAGLDSVAFLRIYVIGLKIFGPMTILALLVLLPVNISGGTLFFLRKELVTSDIDKLSISNVKELCPLSYGLTRLSLCIRYALLEVDVGLTCK